MTLRSQRGEAVTLAVMGIMMAGGMLFWMFSGHSYMSAMHRGGHPASEVRSGEHHGGAYDTPNGRRGKEGDDVSELDRPRAPDRGEQSP
jgi:hypothetical protein